MDYRGADLMTRKDDVPILYTADGGDAAPILRSMRFRWWPYWVLLFMMIANPLIYLIIKHKPVTYIFTSPSIAISNGGTGTIELQPPIVAYTVRPAPPDHPSSNILIDGDIVTIHYTRRSELLLNGCTAQSWYEGTSPNMIWLPDDADGREIRESMMHELMHFALRKAGGEMTDPLNADRRIGTGGESVINPSARIMVDILRDNPKLVEWLGKHSQSQ